jgi:hypothetical protein
MGSVSVRSVAAYTATLYVLVTIVKGGGRAPPTPTSLGKFFHHKAAVATLSVLCGPDHLRPQHPTVLFLENARKESSIHIRTEMATIVQ